MAARGLGPANDDVPEDEMILATLVQEASFRGWKPCWGPAVLVDAVGGVYAACAFHVAGCVGITDRRATELLWGHEGFENPCGGVDMAGVAFADALGYHKGPTGQAVVGSC